MTKVLNPAYALIAAKFTAILDLPTPPFWLNTTRVSIIPSNSLFFDLYAV